MSVRPAGRRRARPARAPHRAARRGAIAALLGAVCAGCAPTVHTPAQPVALPEAFDGGGEAEMPSRWWKAFGDAKLDGLIEEAFRGNLTLAGLWARLEQARALARRSAAPLLPALDGSAGGSRELNSSEMFGRTYTNRFSLGLTAAYEVDIWGRIRSAHEAALLDATASREDIQAAAITVAGSVAEVWFSLIEQSAQVRLLAEQVATNRKSLELITLRFGQGRVPATDVLQQKQLLEATVGEQVRAKAAEQLLRNQLAVLLGRAPGTVNFDVPGALPDVPPLPGTGVPARWIHRRPDVRAALARVRAADHRVAAAIAEKFPRLSLSADASTGAERVRDLFDNWVATMAANLAGPLFDAGLRQAEVDRARAAAAESLAAYGRAVLTAVRELADALSAEAHQRQLLESLRKQRDLAKAAVERIEDRYSRGAAEYLRYLTAQLDYQRLERSCLAARRQLLTDRVDLYRALGAEWDLPAPARRERRVVGPVERVGLWLFGPKRKER